MLLGTFLLLLGCGVYFAQSRIFFMVSTTFSVGYFLYVVV